MYSTRNNKVTADLESNYQIVQQEEMEREKKKKTTKIDSLGCGVQGRQPVTWRHQRMQLLCFKGI